MTQNLRTLTLQIADAARLCGRDPDAVALLAASKFQDTEKIKALLNAGHRLFGENRVQDAQEKYPALKTDYPDIELHLIGPLQTNKVADAVKVFDVIQTLDRPRLATALAAAFDKTGKVLPCFVQVNTGEETQKAGVRPQDADEFILQCRKQGLNITGLMCIPPADVLPAPHFALLAKIAGRHGLTQLSMGMSGDFESAIQFGATHVRIGTALFGERD